ncbi:MAG: Hint domain-containing protein, partial [Planctomycetota bacterium]
PFGEVHRVTTSSRGTCVVEGTEISTPSGKRPVETLRVGDSVWSYDVWRERVVESKVQFRRVGLAHELIDVAPSLSVTPEHPVYTQRGYVPARDLRELDELLGRNRCRRQLSSVRKHRTQRPTRVFDLTTTGPHNFFAGGYLVHNKSRPWWPSVDDHWVVFFEAPPSKVETLFEATPQRSPEQKNVFPAPDPK